MLIDLHVHTSRYSSCGRSEPEEMVAQARTLGLRALVFTEHAVHWPQQELEELQARFPQVRLYCGAEITSAEGDDFLVYGLHDRTALDSGMAAADIIAITHRQHGAVILAHPYRYRDEVPEAVRTLGVDAIEIMSTNIYNYAHQRAAALAQELQIKAVAASDGHHTDMLGLYATEIDALPADNFALAELIRNGHTQIWLDAETIRAQNEALERVRPEIEGFIAQGLSNRDLRELLSTYVNLTVIQGIRDGRDVMRPLQCVPETVSP
ncbi:MAG: PHP domain-containing protein [Anaerolineae bacterium]|jgi:histidinol phosphatase-like PHP family hydrolase|nr:PHP domain-containing protein [Chloroflexota bacterium]